MRKSKEHLNKNLEKGLGEIQLFIIFLFMTFIIIFISLFITIVNYNIIIEDIISDISLRIEKRANIYAYGDEQELQQIFLALKNEYAMDLESIYETKVIPKKIAEEVINNLYLAPVLLKKSGNDLYNHKIYSISINTEKEASQCKLPVVFFEYTPRKYNYVILNQYNKY